MGNTLPKTERLYHKKSMTAFPLRLVYMPMEDGDRCEMLISVPKRNLHRANKRNRVKRQVREAYRTHKDIVGDKRLAMAFIWLDAKLWDSADVEQRVESLLTRVKEKTNENG